MKELVIDYDWFIRDLEHLGLEVNFNDDVIYAYESDILLFWVLKNKCELFFTRDYFQMNADTLFKLEYKLAKLVAGGYEKRDAITMF